MSVAVTRGIRVSVQSTYLSEQSEDPTGKGAGPEQHDGLHHQRPPHQPRAEPVLLALGHRVIVLKGRPSSIHETITIDLPNPRTRDTLREPRFAELRERVWSTLMREAREAEFVLER